MNLLEILEKKVFVIAEIGNNHNGSKRRAFELIDLSAAAGADAVKFQTFKGTDIVSPKVRASEYKGWDVQGFEYWYQFLDTIALKLEDHVEVFKYAILKGVVPFSTPTSVAIVDFLESIDNPIYKIASMDVTNWPLLTRVAATGKPVIMSTGMATEEEVEKAQKILAKNELVILHCISDYPLEPTNVNLRSISYLGKTFGSVVGFSDHSITNEFAWASVAMGARVIEKHITYSRAAEEKAEHHFALEPREFAQLVEGIRRIEMGLGVEKLVRSMAEKENRFKYRRGLHLNVSKKAGEIIDASEIAVVRPALGADASDFELFPGKRLARDVEAWTGLRKEDTQS